MIRFNQPRNRLVHRPETAGRPRVTLAPAPAAAAAVPVEQLESRRLLTMSFDYATGTLTVDSTAGNDVVTVRRMGDMVMAIENGSQQYFDLFRTKKVVLKGNAGDDHLELVGFMYQPASISGGDGNDTMIGGIGNDTLLGGSGNETLTGRDGNDSLVGDDGMSTMYGGNGDDTLRGGTLYDYLLGEAGNDTIYDGANPNTQHDSLIGGTGRDTLYTYGGNDWCDTYEEEPEEDWIFGVPGTIGNFDPLDHRVGF